MMPELRIRRVHRYTKPAPCDVYREWAFSPSNKLGEVLRGCSMPEWELPMMVWSAPGLLPVTQGGLAAVIQVFGLICLVALSLHLAFHIPQIVRTLSGPRNKVEVRGALRRNEQDADLDAASPSYRNTLNASAIQAKHIYYRHSGSK